MKTDVYVILKDRMDKQGLSFQALADKIHMSKDGLYQAFKARRLKFDTVLELCEALQMKPWEIWEDEMAEDRLIHEAKHVYGEVANMQTKLKIIASLTKELQQELEKK